MKYGIQLRRDDDGHTTYVYSSRGQPGLSANLIECALFAQEQSATKMVASYRREGYEPKGHTFSVIEVQYAISRKIDVPRPKQKVGHVISIVYKKDDLFYTAAKKGEISYAQGDIYYGWGHQNKASVFESELKAKIRLQEILEYNERELVEAQKNLAGYKYNPKSSYMGFDRTVEYEHRVQKYVDQIEMLQNAKITLIGS